MKAIVLYKPPNFFRPCVLLMLSGELDPNCFINSSEGWKNKAIGIVISSRIVDSIKKFNALLK